MRGAKGARTEKKTLNRPILWTIGGIVVGVIIIAAVLWIGPIIGWDVISQIVSENLGLGSTIFNAILLFAFLGSIMFAATTVGNSERMEYLLVMPVEMRTIFMEKYLLLIIYSSIFWLVIGTPIIIGFSILAAHPIGYLSILAFVILVLSEVTIGTSIGGLLGLAFAKVLAGRRRLKQIGWAIMTSLGIVVGSLWYASIYLGEGAGWFNQIIDIAMALGFASDLTPGYYVSVMTLGLLVGAPLSIQHFFATLLIPLSAGGLLYLNSYVSELAHYSGWMRSESKRTPKEKVLEEHPPWNPNPFPRLQMSITTSVSMWYNLTSVKRESKVFTQYLLGPLRYLIWLILPVFAWGDELLFILPYMLTAALVSLAVSYGVSFAGYETVYEGRNLMNLQLAAANMSDYVKGKVLSAVPFTIAAASIVGVFYLIFLPATWFQIPAMVIGCIFVNLVAGAIAANAGASNGDFKAERMFTRQRGAAVRPPIKGLAIIKAQLIPNAYGYMGLFGLVLGSTFIATVYGLLVGILALYLLLPVFALISLRLYRSYSFKAGVKLAQLEASEYL